MNFKEEVRTYLGIDGMLTEMKSDTRRKLAGAMAALSIGAAGLHAQDAEEDYPKGFKPIEVVSPSKFDTAPMPKTKQEVQDAKYALADKFLDYIKVDDDVWNFYVEFQAKFHGIRLIKNLEELKKYEDLLDELSKDDEDPKHQMIYDYQKTQLKYWKLMLTLPGKDPRF